MTWVPSLLFLILFTVVNVSLFTYSTWLDLHLSSFWYCSESLMSVSLLTPLDLISISPLLDTVQSHLCRSLYSLHLTWVQSLLFLILFRVINVGHFTHSTWLDLHLSYFWYRSESSMSVTLLTPSDLISISPLFDAVQSRYCRSLYSLHLTWSPSRLFSILFIH